MELNITHPGSFHQATDALPNDPEKGRRVDDVNHTASARVIPSVHIKKLLQEPVARRSDNISCIFRWLFTCYAYLPVRLKMFCLSKIGHGQYQRYILSKKSTPSLGEGPNATGGLCCFMKPQSLSTCCGNACNKRHNTKPTRLLRAGILFTYSVKFLCNPRDLTIENRD